MMILLDHGRSKICARNAGVQMIKFMIASAIDDGFQRDIKVTCILIECKIDRAIIFSASYIFNRYNDNQSFS